MIRLGIRPLRSIAPVRLLTLRSPTFLKPVQPFFSARKPLIQPHHYLHTFSRLGLSPLRPKLSIASPTLHRNAAFWHVGTNLRMFRQILRDSGDSQWKYRLLLFLGLFIVLNFLFNVMMAILTNIYLDRLQPSSYKFGMLVNSEYKQGIVEEMIKMNDEQANRKYVTSLKLLARDNGMVNKDTEKVKSDKEDAPYELKNVLLTDEILDKWYYDKRNPQYISRYCDLLLRFALTLPTDDEIKVLESIDRAMAIITRYEKLSRETMGSYGLKNKALRTKADILKYNKSDLHTVESCYINALKLVEENEFSGGVPADASIVPPGQISSSNLTNSLLDLAALYSDTRQSEYLSKALSILVAELRSLEGEFNALDGRYDSSALYKKQKAMSSAQEVRLMELKFEMIPLLQMQISEILWHGKHHEKAIEMAQQSAQQSSMYSRANHNSAKIAKLGFSNLATMYTAEGDQEAAQMCQKQSRDIEIPLTAFVHHSRNVRQAVLEYWFGPWGNFLFPGK